MVGANYVNLIENRHNGIAEDEIVDIRNGLTIWHSVSIQETSVTTRARIAFVRFRYNAQQRGPGAAGWSMVPNSSMCPNSFLAVASLAGVRRCGRYCISGPGVMM